MKELISCGIYRKPEAICHFSSEFENIIEPEKITGFIIASKREIEEKISGMGLRLRVGTPEDIDAIDRLQRDCFPPDTITLEDPYVLFRIISFGHCILVQTPEGGLVGCHIGVDYNNEEKTSYGIRGCVHQDYRGHNIGALMATYSALSAMERKAYVRRALVSPVSYPALFNNLNYMGHLCHNFHAHLKGFGTRFSICLPLTPGGIKNNRIDLAKAGSFIRSHRPHRDYILISPEDTDGITKMYNETPFRVVAILNNGPSEMHLLALPKEKLGFP